MTLGLKTVGIVGKKTELELLVDKYKETKDSSLLVDIKQKAKEEVGRWFKYQTFVKTFDLRPDEFVEEVALDFLLKLCEGRCGKRPGAMIGSIATSRATKQNLVFSGDALKKEVAYDLRPDRRLELKDVVARNCKGLDAFRRATLYYLLEYGEDFVSWKHYLKRDVLFPLIMIRWWRIRRESMYTFANLEKLFPTSLISKALFLSALYKRSSGTAVLLLLLGDVTKLIQFCSLYGGETLLVPKEDELMALLGMTNTLAGGDLSKLDVTELELLRLFSFEGGSVKDGDPGTLTPVLGEFLRNSVEELMAVSGEWWKHMTEDIPIRGVGEVLHIWDKLAGEVGSQYKLLAGLVRCVDSITKGKGEKR